MCCGFVPPAFNVELPFIFDLYGSHKESDNITNYINRLVSNVNMSLVSANITWTDLSFYGLP